MVGLLSLMNATFKAIDLGKIGTGIESFDGIDGRPESTREALKGK